MHPIEVLVLGDMGMNVKLSWVVVRNFRLASLIAAFGLVAAAAQASVIFTWSGLSSASVPVSFEADLTISGNTLTLVLMNNSPTNSLNPNDCLASFYFGIAGNPALTYSTGVGAVYAGVQSGADTLINASENLTSTTNNAGMPDKWQFKVMNSGFTPFLGYGIGTVGNANLTNSFNGSQVDGLDLSIYRTEVTTANLATRYLVKDTATFTFTGVSGKTDADIASTAAFGMGTAPDSLQIVPEPSSIVLALGGVVLLGMVGRRRR